MSKTIVITGASNGIGLAATKKLAKQGNHVIALCRDNESNRNTIKKIDDDCKTFGKGKVDFIAVNFNNHHSVRQAAHQVINLYPVIDVLICNAGIMDAPYLLTQQKFEQQFQVNYLSQFLFSNLLLPNIEKGTEPRVIFTTSMLALKGKISDIERLKAIAVVKESAYNGWESYRESKLAQMAMSKHMSTLNTNIKFATVHPGVINTNLFYINYGEWLKVLLYPFWLIGMLLGVFKTTAKGAETIVYLATEPTFDTGTYWTNKKQQAQNPIVEQTAYLTQLYEQSKKWVGLV